MLCRLYLRSVFLTCRIDSTYKVEIHTRSRRHLGQIHRFIQHTDLLRLCWVVRDSEKEITPYQTGVVTTAEAFLGCCKGSFAANIAVLYTDKCITHEYTCPSLAVCMVMVVVVGGGGGIGGGGDSNGNNICIDTVSLASLMACVAPKDYKM
jgi:hypothetical protein